jgi:hypothetical protein
MTDTTVPCQTLGTHPNFGGPHRLGHRRARVHRLQHRPGLHDLLEPHHQTCTEVLADHFQRYLNTLQSGLVTTD